MTLALPEEATDPVASIIQELEAAEYRPDEAMRRAVAYADKIAPAVIPLVEEAAAGASLLPKQTWLLFWGIHVLAAARCTALCQPLLRLIRLDRAEHLDNLLGDAVIETVPRILISVFDGDAAPLFDACAQKTADEHLRWGLLDAIARLTFDGAIPRPATIEFLDRFERDGLAAAGDAAWEGWHDAIALLGIQELYDRVRVTWRDRRSPCQPPDQDIIEQWFARSLALAPGDPELFTRHGREPIDDPVEALRWLATGGDDDKEEGPAPDPAASVALNQEEIDWLDAALAGERMPDDAMGVEQIDGYFCALAIATNRSRARESVYAVLDASRARFESDEQAARAGHLIGRIWNAIVDRLDAHYVHRPILRDSKAPKAQRWATGFVMGMQAEGSAWRNATKNETIRELLVPILGLVLNDGETYESLVATPESRAEWAALLPLTTINLYAALRLHDRDSWQHQQPVRSTKIGRNEPCPCGSGKKYKRCCGSADRPVLN